MTNNEFYRKLDSILGLDPGTIQGVEALADLSQWDSMAVLLFIDMMDLDLGVVVSAGALANCRTVGDLRNLAEGKVKD